MGWSPIQKFKNRCARRAVARAAIFFIIDGAGEANHGADGGLLLDILFAP